MAPEPERPKPPDDWTRFSPPPKTRISDRFADPAALFRYVQVGALVLVLGGLGYAVVRYAALRTDDDRRREVEQQKAEPSRSEQRAKSAEEFLRERGMETAPFQKAQEERAKRRKAD